MINRRSFNKILLGTTALSLAACTGITEVSLPANKKRVVIVGGGFGGATAAKYIKRFSPDTEIILIEQNKEYFTCPFSNTVIAGMNKIDYIKHDYKTLEKKYNIIVMHEKVKKVDGATNTVILENGKVIPYTKAIVAPGIDFKYEKGYVEGSEKYAPHAYKAGEQTVLLTEQLHSMKDGGTFVMVAPQNPFRCPPGPYERISLVAHYLKENKPNSKIIILDQKNKFSKQGLFQEGWDKLYKDIIEWRSVEFGGKVVSVDPKNRVVKTEDEEVKADVLNYIPDQKAGKLAFDSGLTQGDWCPVNTKTFESKLVKDIYVIGDAAVASPMPKSGFSANSQAKIAALQISRILANQPVVNPPKLANTCYSLVSPTYGISIAAVYEAQEDKITDLKDLGAGGLSPAYADEGIRMQEAEYAVGWYKNQMSDIFK
ncbi:NAD(P)/FAD-dependent oxidoreductase [Arcobacter aquimarinus]|uniref:Flavocytochrome c sulfide dehydrogenase, flavin-binding n=1 Tax=Arcobacter aquimarinus TaxID=1315211 RepID=A0AAE7B395_9BACT|nr:NAD(P)/FAD-dependent oxidoreductase [Arcobacter aquimarinus]QKE26444.1 flavocytochrome c sulfide dehydrogenase, flavin-binding [Arcobacter aquimarinus]RXI33421.1 sulfide dehydrogenase [Arcobacter aquimarinus]